MLGASLPLLILFFFFFSGRRSHWIVIRRHHATLVPFPPGRSRTGRCCRWSVIIYVNRFYFFFPFLLRPSLVQQLTPRLCYVTRHKRAHQFSVYTTDNIRHGTLVILMRKWTSPGDWRRPRPVLFLPPSGRLSLFFTCPPMLEIERFFNSSFYICIDNTEVSPPQRKTNRSLTLAIIFLLQFFYCCGPSRSVKQEIKIPEMVKIQKFAAYLACLVLAPKASDRLPLQVTQSTIRHWTSTAQKNASPRWGFIRYDFPYVQIEQSIHNLSAYNQPIIVFVLQSDYFARLQKLQKISISDAQEDDYSGWVALHHIYFELVFSR